jgi:two-component system sensor histidine kinase NreB
MAVVEDDGVGFDQQSPGVDGGLGLIGMNERAGSVGGSVEVESQPGKGTRITVRIPTAMESAAHE